MPDHPNTAPQSTDGAALPPTLPVSVQMPATWPTGLSIACFIVGGLGAIVAFFGLLAPFIQDAFASLDASGVSAATVAVQKKYSVPLLGASLIGLCLAVWLIVVGTLILKRRRRAVPMSRAYSFSKIAHAVLLIAVNTIVQGESFQAMQGNMPAGAPAIMGSFASIGLVIGIVFSVLMYMSMPVILLIWFSRSSVRAETANWR